MKRIKEVLLIALIAALWLFVVEAGVRIIAPQHLRSRVLEGGSLAVEDTLLGHRNRPGAVVRQQGPEFSALYVINENGLRDSTTAAPAQQPETLRVLLLGDSFTFGIGSAYDAVWGAVFERTINARGYRVQVLNAGVPGYDTSREVDYLEHYGSQHKPDLVVLALLPHDLSTNAPVQRADTASASLLRRGRGQAGKAPVLHVVTLLQRALIRNDWLYSQLYRRSGRAALLEDPPSDAARVQFEETAALLRRAHAYCRKQGVPFLVLSLPQQFQVLVAAHPRNVEALDVRAVDRWLAQEAERDGFSSISVLDTLAHAYRQDPTPLYYRFDGHLTPRGHRIVGLYVARRAEAMVAGLQATPAP